MPNWIYDKNSSTKVQNKVKGNIGEGLAEAYLKQKGYSIIERNYKVKLGEIDLICRDKTGRIIFVEVKERSTLKFGYPREAVGIQKQNNIRRVAQLYLMKTNNVNCHTRFDVIEIIAGEITHIENAF